MKIDGEINGKKITKDTIDFKEVMKYLQWSISLLLGKSNFIPVPNIKEGSVEIEFDDIEIANLTEDQFKTVIDPDLRENNTEKFIKDTLIEIEEYLVDKPGTIITLKANDTPVKLDSNTSYFYKQPSKKLILKSKGYFSGILKRVNEDNKDLKVFTVDGPITMRYPSISFEEINDNFIGKEVLIYAEYEYDELTMENVPNSYKAITIDFNKSKITKDDVNDFIQANTDYLSVPENRLLLAEFKQKYE